MLLLVPGSISCAEDRLNDRKSSRGQDSAASAALRSKRIRERIDEAALLGERNEDGRRDETEIGIVPAGQRFEADDMIVGERYDRLEMDVDGVR